MAPPPCPSVFMPLVPPSELAKYRSRDCHLGNTGSAGSERGPYPIRSMLRPRDRHHSAVDAHPLQSAANDVAANGQRWTSVRVAVVRRGGRLLECGRLPRAVGSGQAATSVQPFVSSAPNIFFPPHARSCESPPERPFRRMFGFTCSRDFRRELPYAHCSRLFQMKKKKSRRWACEIHENGGGGGGRDETVSKGHPEQSVLEMAEDEDPKSKGDELPPAPIFTPSDATSPASCGRSLFEMTSPGMQWVMPKYFGACARRGCPRSIAPACDCDGVSGQHTVLNPRCVHHAAHMVREAWRDVDSSCEDLYFLPQHKGFVVRLHAGRWPRLPLYP